MKRVKVKPDPALAVIVSRWHLLSPKKQAECVAIAQGDLLRRAVVAAWQGRREIGDAARSRTRGGAR